MPIRLSSRVVALSALLLAACAHPPHAPEPAEAVAVETPAVPPAARDGVIRRDEHFVIYSPSEADSLRSIAARFLGAEDRWWSIADFNGVAAVRPGEPVVVPLRAVNPTGVRPDGYVTVPILCYHRFGPGRGRMVVSQAGFAAQMEYLARNDYRVVRLRDLIDFLQGRAELPRRAVVITVDDGYASFYQYAWPVLKKYGFPATAFVYTDFLGAHDALTWPMMREMTESGLVEIQSHSKSHVNLIQRIGGEADDHYRRRIEAEVRVPRDQIQQGLGKAVDEYAYPYGDANDLVLDQLGQQHYVLGVTVNPGGNPFFAQPYMLRRTMIYGEYDLNAFKARLEVFRALPR